MFAAFNISLAFLHILPVLFDRDRLDLLVWEHEVNTFQLHRDLGIVAEVRMDIAVDAMLLLKNGIVSGDEEQESETNQPDWPCNSLEEPSYMFAGVEALEAIPRVQI